MARQEKWENRKYTLDIAMRQFLAGNPSKSVIPILALFWRLGVVLVEVSL
jgi:hypothetical protein